MPFPYMGIGGALAAGVLLGATLTVFALLLRALDRTVTRVADGICSGLVAGFRGWSDELRSTSPLRSPRATSPDATASPVPVESVRRS